MLHANEGGVHVLNAIREDVFFLPTDPLVIRS